MLAEIAVPEFKFGLAMGCTSRLNLNYMSNFQNLRNRKYYISGHHVSRRSIVLVSFFLRDLPEKLSAHRYHHTNLCLKRK